MREQADRSESALTRGATVNVTLHDLQRRLPRLRPTWLGTASIVALVCVGVSAHAALRAIAADVPPPERPAPRPAGYETEDHFPGAALLYVADENAAPATGATGTTQLPDLPIPPQAAIITTDTTVHAAPPFSMRSASGIDRGRALECLTSAIYYEAATEPEAGQRAVAQVILNRVRHPAFPSTVCGVVYQGSERATGCQFSYACDGSMARVPAKQYWARALRVAASALNGSVERDVGMATHYHTYAVTPAWNRSLVMTAAIGAHFFHRWQGYWGTPAAFSRAYRGGEPVPGPHPRAVLPEADMPLATMAAVAKTPPAPSTPAAAIQPAYAQSGLPTGGYVKPVAAIVPVRDDSQILDRWKDSGKPLR